MNAVKGTVEIVDEDNNGDNYLFFVSLYLKTHYDP